MRKIKFEGDFLNKNLKLTYTKFKVIIIVFTFLTFGARFFTLTSDLPNWGIGNYQAPDEGPYAYLALNQLNYGQINPDVLKDTNINQFTAPHVRGNILGNFLVFLCMKILGDNYVGFRASSLITMLANTIIILLIFNLLRKKRSLAKKSDINILTIFICTSLLTDFTFALASKVVETTIYRMFCVLLCIYIFIRNEESKKLRFFLLGVVSVFSVCGIYITNLFLVVAIGITTMIYFLKDKRKHYYSMIYFFGGGIISFVLCELYYRVFWNTTILRNTLDTLQNFSGIETYTQSGSIYNLLRRGLLFFSSNYNTYNIVMFYLFLLLMPILICEVIRKKDEFLILNLCIYVCLLLQTMYSEDYISRKYIMVVPSLLILCFYGLLHVKEYQERWFSKKAHNILRCYTLFCTCVCLFVLYYRFCRLSDGSVLDYSVLDKNVLWIAASLAIVLLFTNIFINSYLKNIRLKKITCSLFIFSILFPNIYLSSNYLFFNQTYDDKIIMEKLASYQKAEGKTYMLGDYILSYGLYNDVIPVVNNHEEMFTDMVRNNWYFLGYSTKWNKGFGNYMEQELSKQGYKYEIVEEFSRTQTTYGVQRDMALYKAVKIKSK